VEREKDVNTKQLVKIARRQGWTVEPTRGGHLKLIPPNGGQFVVLASTPSDHRVWKNDRARLRRQGLEI
jgi:predicted RNA binding protein YcfA (HicA-like mRNA interferase family)